jgi:hypothetical protein
MFSNYYDGWVSTDTGLGGLPLVSASGILDKYFIFGGGGAAIRVWNNPEARHKMEYDDKNKYHDCKCLADVEEVMNRPMYAGTKMHEHFEDLCNLFEYNKAHPGTNLDQYLEGLKEYPEKAYFFDFVNAFKMTEPNADIVFYRTELMLYHEVLHLTGTIDALLYNKRDNSYIIVDWKRCKGGVKGDPDPNRSGTKAVCDLAPSGRGARLEVFRNMRNNTMNRYGSQLTFYKNLFENMTGERVSAMYIVAVDNTKIGKKAAFKIHNIPLDKYQEGIRQALEERALEMQGHCVSTLNEDHEDALYAIIQDGEKIREAAIENAFSAACIWCDPKERDSMLTDKESALYGCRKYMDVCNKMSVPPHLRVYDEHVTEVDHLNAQLAADTWCDNEARGRMYKDPLSPFYKCKNYMDICNVMGVPNELRIDVTMMEMET